MFLLYDHEPNSSNYILKLQALYLIINRYAGRREGKKKKKSLVVGLGLYERIPSQVFSLPN